MSDTIMLRRTAREGDALYQEGDPANAMYMIHSGKVELLKRGDDGLFDRIALLGPGQVFGEMALLTSRKRTESARTLSDCALIVVERAHLTEKLATVDPFVKALFQILAQNLLSVMDRKAKIEQQASLDDLIGDDAQ